MGKLRGGNQPKRPREDMDKSLPLSKMVRTSGFPRTSQENERSLLAMSASPRTSAEAGMRSVQPLSRLPKTSAEAGVRTLSRTSAEAGVRTLSRTSTEAGAGARKTSAEAGVRSSIPLQKVVIRSEAELYVLLCLLLIDQIHDFAEGERTTQSKSKRVLPSKEKGVASKTSEEETNKTIRQDIITNWRTRIRREEQNNIPPNVREALDAFCRFVASQKDIYEIAASLTRALTVISRDNSVDLTPYDTTTGSLLSDPLCNRVLRSLPKSYCYGFLNASHFVQGPSTANNVVEPLTSAVVQKIMGDCIKPSTTKQVKNKLRYRVDYISRKLDIGILQEKDISNAVITYYENLPVLYDASKDNDFTKTQKGVSKLGEGTLDYELRQFLTKKEATISQHYSIFYQPFEQKDSSQNVKTILAFELETSRYEVVTNFMEDIFDEVLALDTKKSDKTPCVQCLDPDCKGDKNLTRKDYFSTSCGELVFLQRLEKVLSEKSVLSKMYKITKDDTLSKEMLDVIDKKKVETFVYEQMKVTSDENIWHDIIQDLLVDMVHDPSNPLFQEIYTNFDLLYRGSYPPIRTKKRPATSGKKTTMMESRQNITSNTEGSPTTERIITKSQQDVLRSYIQDISSTYQGTTFGFREFINTWSMKARGNLYPLITEHNLDSFQVEGGVKPKSSEEWIEMYLAPILELLEVTIRYKCPLYVTIDYLYAKFSGNGPEPFFGKSSPKRRTLLHQVFFLRKHYDRIDLNAIAKEHMKDSTVLTTRNVFGKDITIKTTSENSSVFQVYPRLQNTPDAIWSKTAGDLLQGIETAHLNRGKTEGRTDWIVTADRIAAHIYHLLRANTIFSTTQKKLTETPSNDKKVKGEDKDTMYGVLLCGPCVSKRICSIKEEIMDVFPVSQTVLPRLQYINASQIPETQPSQEWPL